MNKYYVKVSSKEYYSLLIEAENCSQAEEKALGISYCNRDCSEDGGLDIEEIRKLDDCTGETC